MPQEIRIHSSNFFEFYFLLLFTNQTSISFLKYFIKSYITINILYMHISLERYNFSFQILYNFQNY